MPTDIYDIVTLEESGAADVAFSPDESRLYVAKSSGEIDVFDVVTHLKVATWQIGTSLGAVSITEDGAHLLVVEREPAAGQSVLYRVDTATGAAETLAIDGAAFHDVEITDGDTALLSGGQTSVTLLDLATSEFSVLSGGVYYSNHSVLSEDGRYTLIAETSTSNGPLYLYDDVTDSIVADGDSYQSQNSGFNYGTQTVSEEAGRVLQFIYYGTFNVYDLDLVYLNTIVVGERIGGVSFDETGENVYVYLIDSGALAKYSFSTWTEVERFDVGTAAWHNNISYGNQNLLADGGRYITLLDTDGASGKLQLIDLTIRNETLTGTGEDDVIAGRDGNDILDGGAGNDVTDGGKGNDVHIVGDSGDEIVEAFDEGVDEVRTGLASYGLADADVEYLTGLGSVDQILVGNAGANVINGGGGVDRMEGGEGDDFYFINVSGDQVVELLGQGSDTARAVASYVLSDHVENLILGGGGRINGTGNMSANLITGNDAPNRLDGRGGADTMAGRKGHDTYVVDNLGDKVIEEGSSGNDTVESSVDFSLPTHVERIVLTGTAGRDGRGNSGANSLTGNSGGNFLNGGAGNDNVDGGAGNDRLYGSSGNDVLKGGAGLDGFYFNTAPGTANADRILDFHAPSDAVHLARYVFTRIGPNGTLNTAAFHQGSAAADASDRIVYYQAIGSIFYDSDGSGAAAALLLATVTPGTPLTNADFIIYS